MKIEGRQNEGRAVVSVKGCLATFASIRAGVLKSEQVQVQRTASGRNMNASRIPEPSHRSAREAGKGEKEKASIAAGARYYRGTTQSLGTTKTLSPAVETPSAGYLLPRVGVLGTPPPVLRANVKV